MIPERIPPVARPLTLLALLTLLAFLTALAGAAGAAGEGTTIVKSPADDRDYAAFTLPNGLGVVVVSDPTTDKAAASLDVHVGSGSDPEGREGLAHFLEHMLFLGTEKYPDSAEYARFISSHGGSNNAYTSFDHTNYFFDVNHAHLDGALDRFAQFFVAPRFDPEYVSRERQVVHSEYVSKLKSDGRRMLDARKRAMNPVHPGSRFAVGSNETLADREGSAIRDELVDFYRTHYSAGIMRLAVVGREDVDTLRRMVESRFAAVPDTGAAAQSVDVSRFDPEGLPARLDIVPVREQRQIMFDFPVPPVLERWRSKPTHQIADLLGHEGEGSLLAALKARGWVEGLSAGIGASDNASATFNVTMRLTAEGLDNVEAIGTYLFAYIDLIRRDGITRWRHEEQRRLAELHFRFEEKRSAASAARGIAAALHVLPPEQVLRGGYALDEFDPELIARYLERLRPDNVLVTVVAKGLETDSVTERFATPYRLAPLHARVAATWSGPGTVAALALPEANPFIPENLALLDPAGAAPKPVRIVEQPGLTLWHRQDDEFGLPRTDFFFSVRSPLANASARDHLLASLYVALVNDELETFTYAADLAGMEYALYKHLRGFTVRFSGYSDKEAMLVERIVASLRSPRLDAERFAVTRAEAARRLRNASKRSPARLASAEIRNLLLEPSWSEEEQLAILETLDVEELRAFVPRLLAEIDVVALAHGNLDASTARELAAIVDRGLVERARSAQVRIGEVVRLEPGDRYLRRVESEHEDSALLAYYQGAGRSFADRAAVVLLAEVLSSPFFDVLRTEMQLGYVVYSSPMGILEVPGLAFVVQSPTTAPTELTGHVEQFLREFAAEVESMGPETLDRHKASVISRILARETRLHVRSDRYWTEIDRAHLAFDSRERLAQAVRALDAEAFRGAYATTLAGAARRLIVEAPGVRDATAPLRSDRQAATGASVIDDPAAFRAGKERYPPRGS